MAHSLTDQNKQEGAICMLRHLKTALFMHRTLFFFLFKDNTFRWFVYGRAWKLGTCSWDTCNIKLQVLSSSKVPALFVRIHFYCGVLKSFVLDLCSENLMLVLTPPPEVLISPVIFFSLESLYVLISVTLSLDACLHSALGHVETFL